MPDHDTLERARHTVLAENTAQAVHKHLTKLYEEEARFRSRWIWELLQNARDAAPKTGVNVWVAREADRIVFRHNGVPFTDANVAHLVYHGSTKYDLSDSGAIGQFGTGFLTTHLISKTVTVAGFVSERPFRFMLDRRGATADEVREAMESSWQRFAESLAAAPAAWAGKFTTEFDYPVDARVAGVIDDGIADLIANAAYLLAFNDRIVSLEVRQLERTVTFTKRGSEGVSDAAIRLHIEELVAGQEPATRYVVVMREGGTSVATELGQADARWSLAERAKTPRIFVAFPLTATADFCLPVVVNDELFQPREDRDTLFLRPNREGPHPNQPRMALACTLAFRLASTAAGQQWGGAAALARLREVREWDWVDSDWLRTALAERFVQPTRAAPVMANAEGNRIAPRDGTIPVAAGAATCVDLWDIVEPLPEATKKLPLRAEASVWAENIASWASVIGQSVDEMEECLTLTKLCERVAGWGSLSKSETVTRDDIVGWLNSLYALISKAGLVGYFEQFRLIPNQTGALKKITELRRDGGIDEELKDIAERLGVAARADLLDRRVRLAQLDDLQQKTEAEVLAAALQKLKERAKAVPADPEFAEIAVQCFRWLVGHGHTEKLDGLPVVTRASTPEEPTIATLMRDTAKPEDVLLAPTGCWPEATRIVADLFPKRQTMADAYHDAVPDAAQWATVTATGLLRLEPLFTTRRRGIPFITDEPLPVPEKEKKLKHRTKDAVEVSALAFFEKEDTGLDSVRRSKTRAVSLLLFLADHVLPLHPFALEPAEAECECGATHRYYPSAWLVPMWGNQWVPLGDSKQAEASAESIARLFEGREDDLRRLTSGAGRKLLESLGISLADLGLRAVAKDESTRISLIDSLSDIVSAAGHDTGKVRLLADEIKQSPGLFEEIQEHRERREKVQRNQSLGAEVERLLREALEAHGMTVTRTGVGSDYEVEDDFIVDDEEVILTLEGPHRSLLVEVKATRGDAARMTVRQAEEAVANKDRFALSMVRLGDAEITAEAVRTQCRFIFNIGDQIGPVWAELSRYRKAKESVCTRVGDVELVVTDAEVRFAVGQGAWDAGLPLEAAVERIRGLLSCSASPTTAV